MNQAFNAAIDDLELDPVEFRVYCHILRRGDCWEAMSKAAKHCKVSERTYRRAVHRLIYEHALVSFTERPGQTNIYRVIPIGKPNQSVQMPVTPTEADRAPLPNLTAPPSESDRRGGTDLTAPPLPNLTDKVLPTEVLTKEVGREVPYPPPKPNTEAFETFVRLVGLADARFLAERKAFNFAQAVSVWRDTLPELWLQCLRLPNRHEKDKPLYRFQEACERTFETGLVPPPREPETFSTRRGQLRPSLSPGDHARTPDGQTRTILDVCPNGMVVFEDDSPPVHQRSLEPVLAAVA